MVAGIVLLTGCKPNPTYVKSGILSSIYDHREFFDVVCGFPIDPMYAASVQVEVEDIQAESVPVFGGEHSAPGTAKLILTGVHKKGDSTEKTCEAKISYRWTSETKAVTEGIHRQGATSTSFHAFAFKKL